MPPPMMRRMRGPTSLGVEVLCFGAQTTTQLWFGVTHATSTTNQWTPQFVSWASAN